MYTVIIQPHSQEQLKNKGGEILNKEIKQPIFSLLNILIAFLVIVAIAIAFLWIKSGSNDEEASLKKDISALQEDVDFYETAKEDYKPSDVNNKIAEDKINIKESFDKKKQDITKGVTQVYDKTKTQKDYDKLDELITPYLGDKFSERLIELNKPVVNESGKEQFPYDKLEDVNIAFGEYDIVNHTAECFVLVNYQSPEVGANNPGVKRKDKQAVIKGQDFFILNFNLEDDSLELVNYQQNAKSEAMSDE